MTKRVCKQAAIVVLLVGALAGCKPDSFSMSIRSASATVKSEHSATQPHAKKSVKKKPAKKKPARKKTVQAKSVVSNQCIRRVLQRPTGNC